MVFKNSIKTSFHLNNHFQNFKFFCFDFASPKILKSFRNINKFYISQVENLSEDKHMSMVFHSNITGLYSFILGRPTYWGPQTYILTTTGYCANFFQNIYAHNFSNYNPRLWSKFYIYISNTSREIAKIPNLHIGGHEKKATYLQATEKKLLKLKLWKKSFWEIK